MKMGKIRSHISKFSIIILIFVCYVESFDVQIESQHFESYFSFEQMKFHLFTAIGKNISNYANTSDDWKCLQELNAIGNGLKRSELWAVKIIDAWGKWPSPLPEGKPADFGAFSECFHIDRNDERFKTTYCLGGVGQHRSGLIPRSTNGSLLRVGMCMPADCSVEFLQNYFISQTKNMRNPIRLIENSCQLEKNPSHFTVLDWIFIGFLITILTFILMSTTYDILCTVYNREKHQIFLAFSLCSNSKQLFSCEIPKSADAIRCLDGIRAITSQWVVFRHTQLFYEILPAHKTNNIKSLWLSYIETMIFHFPTQVDTFFVLSGLLVTISMLKQLERTNGKVNATMLYIHRYLRLTPLLAVSILFIMTLYRFCGSGPIWPSNIDDLVVQCEKKWWQTLLYIQNYGDSENLCNAPSWYQSVDMQLFLLSPFIAYLIYRFKKRAICVLVILTLGCVGRTISVISSTAPILTKTGVMHYESLDDYTATHLRCSPWLVGVIAGYIFHGARRKTIHIPRVINLIAWILSLAFTYAIVFTFSPHHQVGLTYTPLGIGLYTALRRVGWAIALCYIIFACHHNYGGVVNWFLGHPLWQPLSRLSFSVYMIQWPLFYIIMGSTKNSLYLDELMLFQTAFGNYGLVILVAIIAELGFQSPINIIETWIFSSRKKRDNENSDKKKQ